MSTEKKNQNHWKTLKQYFVFKRTVETLLQLWSNLEKKISRVINWRSTGSDLDNIIYVNELYPAACLLSVWPWRHRRVCVTPRRPIARVNIPDVRGEGKNLYPYIRYKISRHFKAKFLGLSFYIEITHSFNKTCFFENASTFLSITTVRQWC